MRGFVGLFSVCLVLTAAGADEERVLKEAEVPATPAGLIAFLGKHSLRDGEIAAAERLVRQLGEAAPSRREEASAALREMGARVRGLMARAARSANPEIAGRAAAILRALPAQPSVEVLSAAVRVLARSKELAAAEALLSFLPAAPTAEIEAEVVAALTALSRNEAGAAALLVERLADPIASRRAAAAEALCKGNRTATFEAVRRLLQDPDQDVALRVGFALFDARDASSVPVLIALLSTASRLERWHIEDALTGVAGHDSPAVPVGDDPAAACRSRELWMRWWRTHGTTLDLSKAPPRTLGGATLVVLQDRFGEGGRVVRLAQNNDPEWTTDNLGQPLAAEFLANGRILIVEFNPGRISERDAEGKGAAYWEKQLPQPPVAAQRMPNGNTFVACRNRLGEFTPEGREVLSLTRPVRDIIGARRFPDGPLVVLTDAGFCEVLNTDGKPLHRFPVKGPHAVGTGIDVVPGRRILVPIFSENRVVEYDLEGNVAWQVQMDKPTAALRLANGHTLATSAGTRRVLQLDRAGQVVWSYAPHDVPVFASRR